MVRHISEIGIFTGEAREHLGVFDDSIEIPCAVQEICHVKYYFIEACLNIERCIPGAAIGSIEPVQFPWLCVGETRIDESRVGHTLD